jgi:hypothetical protein
MDAASERFHAWNHLVLFLMLFAIALAVLRLGAPTGLATGNQSLAATGVGDLKPFLTAVGLLMGLLIAAAAVLSANAQETRQNIPAKRTDTIDLATINNELMAIRRKLRR